MGKQLIFSKMQLMFLPLALFPLFFLTCVSCAVPRYVLGPPGPLLSVAQLLHEGRVVNTIR